MFVHWSDTRLAKQYSTGIKLMLVLMSLQLTIGRAEQAFPNLYQISDKDSSIYLFGTMHYLPDGTQWLKANVKQKLQNSDYFIMELDMADPSIGLRVMQSMQAHLLTKDGSSLLASLTKDEQQQLAAALAQVKIPEPMIDKLAPGIAVILLQAVMAQSADFEPGTGAELRLMQLATQQGLEISGLETPEQQLAIFVEVQRSEAIALLKQTLSQLQMADAYLKELLNAWLSNDSKALTKGFEEMRDVAPKLTANLMENRNKRWLPVIEGYLKDNKQAFVAVGAGHVVGTSGLLEMLKAKGYSVTVH